MEEEAADELVDFEGAMFECAAVISIAIRESDLLLVDSGDAVVGDGDTMGIAAEVIEELFRRTERPFRVDIPGFVPQGLDELVEASRIGSFSREDEFLFLEGAFEGFEEFSTEDDAQRFIVEEEAFTGRDPAGVVEGEGSLGEEAMEVEMVLQLLIPGMQHQSKARGAVEVCVGEFHEDFGDDFEQEVQKDPFVTEDEGVEFVGERKHHMEGSGRQELSLLFLEPLSFG